MLASEEIKNDKIIVKFFRFIGIWIGLIIVGAVSLLAIAILSFYLGFAWQIAIKTFNMGLYL
jgi:hypothetical protein